MTPGLTEELKVQLEGMQQWNSYENKKNAVQRELDALQKEIIQLEEASRKEDKDVVKLEKGGLHAFYLKVRGKYEETMDQEVLEAAVAKLKLENKRFEAEDAKRRIQSMESEQRKYDECEEKYKELYDRKKQELLLEDNKASMEILELNRKCSDCEHMTKELREAIYAGNEVLSGLESVKGSLDDAEDWGVFDIMGGGMMSDMMKHSHLDDAKSGLDDVQELMGAFRTELADVRMTLDITIDTNGFSKFADFFFDGLFADLNMQDRIHDAQSGVDDSITKVEEVIRQLETLCTEENNRIQGYQDEIVKIVNNA